MNIFKILSDNDGKIHEPSITSLLAYLLDADEDHGLSSRLLEAFVEECNNENPDFSKGINYEQYDVVAEATLERDKEAGTKKKTIDFDILILFYPDKKADTPSHILGIENKIKDSSRRKFQLQQEWAALKNKKEWEKANLFLCFLTPTNKNDDDFENVPSNQKIHLVWKSDTDKPSQRETNEPSKHRSVLEMLVNILQKEQLGEIDPIPGDSKFLIKSLLAFIRADFKAKAKDSVEEAKERRDYGKPIWQYFAAAIEKYDFDKDIDFDYLLEDVRSLIRQTSDNKEYGKDGRGRATLMKLIVNNRSRYDVTEDNHDRYDLLFSPSPGRTKIVRRYNKSNPPPGVKIFCKQDGQKGFIDPATGAFQPD